MIFEPQNHSEHVSLIGMQIMKESKISHDVLKMESTGIIQKAGGRNLSHELNGIKLKNYLSAL